MLFKLKALLCRHAQFNLLKRFLKRSSLLSQVVKVASDIIAFRRWVASSSSTSTVPFADADADQTETQTSATAALSSPLLSAQSGNEGQSTSDNNDDQSLSEDPRLPTQITPTPSRDVLPRELPSKVFGAKKPPSSTESVAVVVDGIATKDNDNMSGVSTSTSASSSASSRTDTVGPSFLSKKRKKVPEIFGRKLGGNPKCRK